MKVSSPKLLEKIFSAPRTARGAARTSLAGHRSRHVEVEGGGDAFRQGAAAHACLSYILRGRNNAKKEIQQLQNNVTIIPSVSCPSPRRCTGITARIDSSCDRCASL